MEDFFAAGGLETALYGRQNLVRIRARGLRSMIALYSYPELFGVADNNGYGLKVVAFMRLAGVPFSHEHIFDASAAPRGQLPYIVDDGETIGDSETIVAHLIGKYGLTIDAGLTPLQHNITHLVTRMLDDLYWVMSYSRWKDERYWPAFRDALMREHPTVTEEGLLKAREFNFQRYYYAGIGRYEPRDAYARGLADLYFFEIDTELKRFVTSQPNLVRHCTTIHETVMQRKTARLI